MAKLCGSVLYNVLMASPLSKTASYVRPRRSEELTNTWEESNPLGNTTVFTGWLMVTFSRTMLCSVYLCTLSLLGSQSLWRKVINPSNTPSLLVEIKTKFYWDSKIDVRCFNV